MQNFKPKIKLFYHKYFYFLFFIFIIFTSLLFCYFLYRFYFPSQKQDLHETKTFPNGKVEQFKNGKLIREICTNGTINEFDEEGHFTKTIGFNGYIFTFDHKNNYISLKTPDNYFIEYKNEKPFRITYPDKSIVNVIVDENGNIVPK